MAGSATGSTTPRSGSSPSRRVPPSPSWRSRGSAAGWGSRRSSSSASPRGWGCGGSSSATSTRCGTCAASAGSARSLPEAAAGLRAEIGEAAPRRAHRQLGRGVRGDRDRGDASAPTRSTPSPRRRRSTAVTACGGSTGGGRGRCIACAGSAPRTSSWTWYASCATAPDRALHVHYCGDHGRDARHARHLAGLPGVTLVPHRGDGHRLVTDLRDRGDLAQHPRRRDRLTPHAPRVAR